MNSSTLIRIRTLVYLLCVLLVACSKPANLPDDGFVDVPGGRVAFRVFGAEKGVPLLVLHGGPGGSSCGFVTTLTDIAKDRPVVVYDQLGSGHSDRIADLESLALLPRFVEEIVAIREELGLDEIHLMGGSWGAAVVVEYLLTKAPEGVLSATLAGPYIGTARWIEDAGILVGQLSEESQQAIAEALASGDFTTAEFRAANVEFSHQFGSRSGKSVADFKACTQLPPGNSGLYEYMWGPTEFIANGTLKDYDRISRLPELRLPVLFIVGEFDEARPATMLEYQKLVSGSKVEVIADAGHFSMGDKPKAFNDAVRNFLNDVESR